MKSAAAVYFERMFGLDARPRRHFVFGLGLTLIEAGAEACEGF